MQKQKKENEISTVMTKDQIMRKVVKATMSSVICLFLLLLSPSSFCQDNKEILDELQQVKSAILNNDHTYDEILKKIDDVLWFDRVGDVAYVDKVYICGPPRWKEENPTGIGAGNPLKLWSYVFIPKTLDPNRKYPLLVFAHSGVHGNISTYYSHIIREMMAQEYVVVAMEYRGSIGYGRATYENIDYGGREVEDVRESRNYMLENYSFIDKDRIGIIGWSHGGTITLLNLFRYPDDYKVGFAGVPVSDLIARMAYTKNYERLFSADYHIGKTVSEDIQEYRRRSPVWHAAELKTPLLIHTNTIDEDVNVLEVESMINALKAEGKQFEYKIFEDIPGGHSFDRMDHKQATDIRFTIYKFLEKYLKPNKPFRSADDMRRAGYRFN